MYVLIVEVLIYKEIKLTQLPGIMRESMVMVGGILLIIGVSMALTNYMIDAEVPMRLFSYDSSACYQQSRLPDAS